MPPPLDATGTWKAAYRFAGLIKPLFCRLTVEGSEHIPRQGGCIVTCNHTMGPDFVLLGYASPRQIYYMAKEELFRINPLITKILVSAGVFPVRRGRQDTEAIKAAVNVVKAGNVLGMFPEGTRSRTGVLGRGKSGAARIAMHANAPIVPSVVINSEAILRQIGRRPQVIVRFGPPICLVDTEDEKEDASQHTETIMKSMAALLPPTLRGDYES